MADEAKTEGIIKNWLHVNGEAYPVDASNIVRVHKFAGLLFADTVAIESSRHYGDNIYYKNRAIVVKEEAHQKALCDRLGCDYNKLVNKEKPAGKSGGKTGQPIPNEDVPF